MMQDLMLDLETLGLDPGAAILSVGMVWFDVVTLELGPTFYSVISRAICEAAGLYEDDGEDGALQFHQKTQLGRDLLEECGLDSAPDLRTVMSMTNDFMLGRGDDFRIWGNAWDFDGGITKAAMKAVGIRPRWNFRNTMCYRGFKNTFSQIQPIYAGHKHHALDDAINQARHTMEIVRAVGPAIQFKPL